MRPPVLWRALLVLAATAAFGTPGAGLAAPKDETVFNDFLESEAPVRPGSRTPNLFAAADGQVYLNWLEPAGPDRYALRFSVWQQTRWGPPRTIAASGDWFVNEADFPAVVGFPDGRIAAHWLQLNGQSRYAFAYDINIVTSSDGGNRWGPVLVPHRDGTPNQHGFVSMLPGPRGQLTILWLDGRNYASPADDQKGTSSLSERMTLRVATLDAAGRLKDEAVLDRSTCSCCQTGVAATATGAIAVYRDRTSGEVRDISVVRYDGQTWSAPTPVHRDGWEIAGCPVNGPAVAARQNSVAVAWFTAAQDVPRVNITFSRDGGETFGAPLRVDSGDPAGRVNVILLPSGAAIVGWLEIAQEGDEYRVRKVDPDGRMSAANVISFDGPGQPSGFPRMVRTGSQVHFAWTQVRADAQGENRVTVRTAVATLQETD